MEMGEKEEFLMKMAHYFVTKENYTPVSVKGIENEIWLENLDAKYKVIRINNNYIHNETQYDEDLNKLRYVMKQIKKRTISFDMNALNIVLDVSDSVNLVEEKNIVNIKGNVEEIKKNVKLNEIFPDFSNKLINDNNELRLLNFITRDINAVTLEKNKGYEKIFKPKVLIVTPIIILICVFMLFITARDGGYNNIATLIKYGANNALLVKEGDIYRLVTSIFLHAGIFHLLVNMYSLAILGKQLETFIGKYKFLGVFLISGIIGSMLSIVCNDSLNVSVGASGAIFGLAASLIYFGYYYRIYLSSVIISQLVPIIGINLIIGFMSTGIDNAAHIGGLIGGYLASVALGITDKTNKGEKINGLIALIALMSFLSYLIFK